VLAVAEVWFIATYDDKPNLRSTRLSEIDFIHWKMQVWRGLAIAAVDGGLGWVIWLQATGRAFITPPAAGERLADHGRLLEGLLSKTRGLGVMRNSTVRDTNTRSKASDYWTKEGEIMRDVFEQPEVLESQRNALRRLDTTKVGRDAEAYIGTFLGSVQIVRNAGAPS